MVKKTKKYLEYFKTFVACLVLFFFFVGNLYALNSYSSGYQLTSYQSRDIYYSSSQTCQNIRNNTSNYYFIPTRTSGEWNSFYNNRSRLGVTVNSCVVPPTPANCLSGTYCSGYNNRVHVCLLHTNYYVTCAGEWWINRTNVTSSCEGDTSGIYWYDYYNAGSC
ncbi:MAG: hypothetical protein V1851_02150 [Patescibacteria group bacterium]